MKATASNDLICLTYNPKPKGIQFEMIYNGESSRGLAFLCDYPDRLMDYLINHFTATAYQDNWHFTIYSLNIVS